MGVAHNREVRWSPCQPGGNSIQSLIKQKSTRVSLPLNMLLVKEASVMSGKLKNVQPKPPMLSG